MANGATQKHVVVVGGGIGGTATALLLAHAGLAVTLIEKNRKIGGSCAGYDKQGFAIDVGTHMFCRGPKGPLGEVLRRVDREDAIEFRRTRDIAELRLCQKPGEITQIPVPAELHRMPGFVYEIALALRLTPREAMRSARFIGHIMTMPAAEIETWNHRSVEEYIRMFTDHPPTLSLFGFLLGLYFILPYWEVSAGEAIWSFQKMVRDNHLSYPKGGSRAIPETYAKLAERFGATVRLGVGCRQIVQTDGRVSAVELTDGSRLEADLVVSTSSVKTTMTTLMELGAVSATYLERAKSIRGSYIAVQAKIGLSRRLVEAGCLVGGVGDGVDLLTLGQHDLKDMFLAVQAGRVPRVVPFYCPVPSNFDPDLAPPGHQLLTVCAVAPTSDITLHDPAPMWEDAMMNALERVVPDLHKVALFVDRFSVDFIERWIGKEGGAAVSTGQTPDQVGSRRPGVRTPVVGLYMAGCGAGGRGVGTELAATSAMECVDAILTDLHLPVRTTSEPSRLVQLGTLAQSPLHRLFG